MAVRRERSRRHPEHLLLEDPVDKVLGYFFEKLSHSGAVVCEVYQGRGVPSNRPDDPF